MIKQTLEQLAECERLMSLYNNDPVLAKTLKIDYSELIRKHSRLVTTVNQFLRKDAQNFNIVH